MSDTQDDTQKVFGDDTPLDGMPTGADRRNISTEHQAEGDAALPSDTLDRPAEQVHPARDFDPAADVGRADPGNDNA